ncbi:IS66 family transposase [Desulfovibrio psychrotolerans]|uniref:IS66 family transposase n=1 Tax=Desulfovibrio psychrotolerans TaxID=415242 RepID=UPI00237AE22C|nr:transposase [Desulfovibrio psychrotolerans]
MYSQSTGSRLSSLYKILNPKPSAGYVLASKFVDGLPFYRQECMFARLGLDVSRSTMCGWALRVAQPLQRKTIEFSRSGQNGCRILDHFRRRTRATKRGQCAKHGWPTSVL